MNLRGMMFGSRNDGLNQSFPRTASALIYRTHAIRPSGAQMTVAQQYQRLGL